MQIPIFKSILQLFNQVTSQQSQSKPSSFNNQIQSKPQMQSKSQTQSKQDQSSRNNNSMSWTQITFQPEINLTHIQSNHYFMLINKKYNNAVTYRLPNGKKMKYQDQHAIIEMPDQKDIQQIFQIQLINQEKYQIVHGKSTLVFTQEEQQVMLRFGNWKNNQFWYPQQIETNSKDKLEYWIKSSKTSNKYLYYDGFALRCGTIDPKDQSTIWEIKLCLKNQKLNKSCWLEYAFSNQVIDVPGATDKPDTQMIQYPCNYRFNQRFYIEAQQPKSLQRQTLYTIQNLKTEQFLTVNQSAFLTSVIQTYKMPKLSLYQLWRIEYVSVGLYKIRSAVKDNMYLVVKDRSAKIQEPLRISDNQNWCLWKIAGNFNIMPNKDFQF